MAKHYVFSKKTWIDFLITIDEASKAIDELNGKVVGSKPICVTLIKCQERRSPTSNHRYTRKANHSEISPAVSTQSPPVHRFSTRLYTPSDSNMSLLRNRDVHTSSDAANDPNDD